MNNNNNDNDNDSDIPNMEDDFERNIRGISELGDADDFDVGEFENLLSGL